MKVFAHIFILVNYLLLSLSSTSQMTNEQRQAILLTRQLQLNHYNPRQVNDSLSSIIFTSFIKELDGQHDIFTTDDFKILSAYRYLLDDELNKGKWNFLPLVTKLYRQRMVRADSIAKTILQKPIDFSTDDKLVFTKENNDLYATDLKELVNKWTKWFKYIILSHAYNSLSSDSIKQNLASVLVKNEPAIREKIKKGHAKTIESILDPANFETGIKEIYFNAISTSFDPHSTYFSPQQKKDFQAELSTEEYSFGFEIDENKEGKIFIDLLIPGGPAWKTGEIHKNDELLQVQWKGEPPVDISAVTIEEVDELFEKPNHDELNITIKKQNGTVRTVALYKEKIETEESVVKGYLLTGNRKIGYISLPGFYTTWEDEKGSGCANDMAKEIIMMKKENPEGLILDLRYNGGGSLGEALQLCGIFIDEGPLAGIREKDGKVIYSKDPNRGTIYDGPLIVLVNNQSASASELVAATLQDYNRAVIVGSPTYGKATMQVVLPMDSTRKTQTNSPDGFVKITTGKLYRVSGLTIQCNGVIPDIIIPDAFDGLEYREKFMPQSIPADTTKKNNYYKPLSGLPVAPLMTSSQERIKNNPSFIQLQKGITMRTTELANKKTIIPLKPDMFEKWIKEKDAMLKEMDEKDETENKIFTADNYRQEKIRLHNNVYATDLNDAAIKSIQKDIYIQEAFQILDQLINLMKTK